MSFKRSSNAVEKNSEAWQKNLSYSCKNKRKPSIPDIESLSVLSKMPTNRQVIGNYRFLLNSRKNSRERINIIGDTLAELWTRRLNFPKIQTKSIKKKLKSLIGLYERNRKKPSANYEDWLLEVFDITDITGDWKTTEDKDFYAIQMKSGAKIGYSTGKKATINSIHPRKRSRSTISPESIVATIPGKIFSYSAYSYGCNFL